MDKNPLFVIVAFLLGITAVGAATMVLIRLGPLVITTPEISPPTQSMRREGTNE